VLTVQLGEQLHELAAGGLAWGATIIVITAQIGSHLSSICQKTTIH
jgi:hypothetical protein